jgi:branched-chain amino acid transport system substrate-binding protein
VLKLVAAKPDAVLVAGSGTPAALPQKTLKERGYAGKYYQTHGVANNDFLRVGGKDVEGTVLPAGPILVAAQLPDSNPIKAKVALDYVTKYESGQRRRLGGRRSAPHAPGTRRSCSPAAVPAALKAGKPGPAEFRAALRDAMEAQKGLVMSHGIAEHEPDGP